MKYLLAFLLLLVLYVGITNCVSKKKVEYNVAPTSSPATAAIAIDSYWKGKTLFRLHCASCHGIFEKGKDSVPNFTKTQIDNYNAMFIRGDPKNHSVAQKMSSEQLYMVLTFLRMRKR